MPKQSNLSKLGDAGRFKCRGCPTQPEPILASRSVYAWPQWKSFARAASITTGLGGLAWLLTKRLEQDLSKEKIPITRTLTPEESILLQKNKPTPQEISHLLLSRRQTTQWPEEIVQFLQIYEDLYRNNLKNRDFAILYAIAQKRNILFN